MLDSFLTRVIFVFLPLFSPNHAKRLMTNDVYDAIGEIGRKEKKLNHPFLSVSLRPLS